MLLLVAVVGSMFSPLFSSVANAQTSPSQTPAATTPSGHTGIDDFGCSVSNATGANGGRGFALCMSQIVYAIGPGLASYVAYVGAYFFGFMVQFSLNSTSYALSFLADGWKIVRDVANMAFIFILIWIALTIMYNAQTHDTMKMLAGVIVVALLVNFSFFVTRVVIDAGNIFAVQFYNAIDTKGQLLEGTQIKDLSAAIMNAVGLQSLFSANAFDSATKASGGGPLGGFIVLSFIYISIAAMLWVLFFAFVQVGIKFLMRVVGLWFVLIASPAAFVAGAVKGTREYFRQWLKLLLSFAFYPAVFLFIFYILVIFINGMLGGSIGASGAQTSLLNQIFNSAASTPNAVGSAGPNAGVGSAIASVFIRMGLVVAMLYVGLKAADWIISTGTDAARNATGWVTGKAFGTAAFGGRLLVGGTGNLIAKNGRLANSKNILARGLWRGANFVSKRSFDPRNIPGVRGGVGLLTQVDIGAGGGKGGWRATEKWARETQDKWRKNIENDRKEVNDRLKRIQAREDGSRLAEIERTWESDEAELKTLRTAASAAAALGVDISPADKKKLDDLEKLNTERTVLVGRMEKMGEAQASILKADDLKSVIHHMSESTAKAIRESAARPGDVAKELGRAWDEKSKHGALHKSEKELEKLDKIHEKLKTIGVTLASLDTYAKKPPVGTTVTVNLKATEAMVDETKAQKEHFEDIRDDTSKTPAERQTAREKARRLGEVLSGLDKLVEHVKNVPEKVGESDAPAEFKVTGT